MERVIDHYVDRNLLERVCADRAARSVDALATYNSAVRRHCIEAALIMRSFAADEACGAKTGYAADRISRLVVEQALATISNCCHSTLSWALQDDLEGPAILSGGTAVSDLRYQNFAHSASRAANRRAVVALRVDGLASRCSLP